MKESGVRKKIIFFQLNKKSDDDNLRTTESIGWNKLLLKMFFQRGFPVLKENVFGKNLLWFNASPTNDPFLIQVFCCEKFFMVFFFRFFVFLILLISMCDLDCTVLVYLFFISILSLWSVNSKNCNFIFLSFSYFLLTALLVQQLP